MALTLLTAFALTIFPLPSAADPYRPDWVMLTVVFWAISIPSWIGVGVAWLCGIALDTLKGGILGQHALALSVVTWIAFLFHRRIRVFPIWQETFTVLVLLLIYHSILVWIEGVTGASPTLAWYKPVLGSVLLWPIWVSLLNAIARRTR